VHAMDRRHAGGVAGPAAAHGDGDAVEEVLNSGVLAEAPHRTEVDHLHASNTNPFPSPYVGTASRRPGTAPVAAPPQTRVVAPRVRTASPLRLPLFDSDDSEDATSGKGTVPLTAGQPGPAAVQPAAADRSFRNRGVGDDAPRMTNADITVPEHISSLSAIAPVRDGHEMSQLPAGSSGAVDLRDGRIVPIVHDAPKPHGNIDAASLLQPVRALVAGPLVRPSQVRPAESYQRKAVRRIVLTQPAARAR
jgi:hypothetical protein